MADGFGAMASRLYSKPCNVHQPGALERRTDYEAGGGILTDDQKQQFRDFMNLVFETYRQPRPNKEVLRLWWAKLERYELQAVCKSLDAWIETKTHAPSPADIIELCRHKVTIHAKLPSPLNVAENKRHADELMDKINQLTQPKRDYKKWARDILENIKGKSEVQIRFAQEALSVLKSEGQQF